MKNFTGLWIILMLCTSCESFFEQKRENIIRTGVPVEVRYNVAFVEGLLLDISDREEKNILAYGHAWSLNPAPTTADQFTDFGNASRAGTFLSFLGNLETGVSYHVRAYLTTNEGTEYGDEIVIIPGQVSTLSVTNISSGSASAEGAISPLALATNIKKFGHCWATHNLPTLADNEAEGVLSSGTSYFTTLRNLKPSTRYFVRAFLIDNSGATSYGQEIIFKTDL